MNSDDERDHSEERYNRNLCPSCDASPCIGGAGKGSCWDADIFEATGVDLRD